MREPVSLIIGLHAECLWLDLRAETRDRPQNVWQERCEPVERDKTLWRFSGAAY